MAEQVVSLGPRDVIGAALINRARHDEAFRAELVRDPRAVVERELGLLLPGRLRIEVRMEQPVPGPGAMSIPAAVAVSA